MKSTHALGAGAAEIDLFGPQRGEDQKLVARPGDRDVKPAVAAVAVERGDLCGDAAGLVGADGHREEDDVALVALHVLEVLDEDRLVGLVAVEKRLQRRVAAARLVEQVLDQPLLLAVEGDDADRLRSTSFMRLTTSATTASASLRFTLAPPRS